MTTEVLLYELVLILIIGLSVYNVAYSAIIWLKLHLGLTLLLVLWPLAVLLPSFVELRLVHVCVDNNVLLGDMLWRWVDVSLMLGITVAQLLTLRFGRGTFRRRTVREQAGMAPGKRFPK